MRELEIIILSGIPCSGKTTFTRKPEYKNHLVISRDDIREKYWSNYKMTRENENEVTKIFNRTFEAGRQAKLNMILDNTHCKETYLMEWLNRRPDNYTVKIVFFEVSLLKAFYRNVKRWIIEGKWIPFKVIYNMKKNFDQINKCKHGNIFHV